MRQGKTRYVLVAAVFGIAFGCQTSTTSEDMTKTEDMTTAAGPNDVELPVGCAPANKIPYVSKQVMGEPSYMTPGCEPVTTAAVDDEFVGEDEEMASGDEALPPLAEIPADTEAQNDDIVEGEGGTPCGLTVTSLSAAAVGDPCMTTEGVIEALGLEGAQRDAALAGVSDARTMFGDQAVAH